MKIAQLFFVMLIVWSFSSMMSAYDARCMLGGRLYVIINNKFIRTIFIAKRRGTKVTEEKNKNKMSIMGIICYLILCPSLLRYTWLWFIQGIPNRWFSITIFLFVFLLIINVIDFAIGAFFCSLRDAKTNKLTYPLKIRWDMEEVETEHIKENAEEVFQFPAKIIYDRDGQEFFYIRGDKLLKLGVNGDFISLSPDANSPAVLKAMQMGTVVWK